jgi:hypothetical protein
MEAFELRLWDNRIGRWITPDPAGVHPSPYLGIGNNPIRLIDPDGAIEKEAIWNDKTKKYEWNTLSDLGGEDVNYFHYVGGKYDGKTKVVNAASGDNQWMKSSAWLRGYTQRDTDVTYLTITNEFLKGTGPERSLMADDHPMNKDIKNSNIFNEAVEKFKESGLDKKIYVPGEFGADGAVKAGDNMTAQMLGKAGISFYPIGDKVVIFVTDSKSINSLNPAKKFDAWLSDDPDKHNVERVNGKGGPKSTTHQSYIFHVSKHFFTIN